MSQEMKKQRAVFEGTPNGVDVQRLFETLDVVKQMPKAAKFRFRARNAWLDGAHNRSEIHHFEQAGEPETKRQEPFVFDNDEPPVLLGRDRGANPVEFVLHALAGCLTTSLVYNAAVRGIELRSVESELEGDIDLHGFLALDPNVRNGYQQIRVTFKIDSDAPREKLEELVQIAQQRSPVFDSVSNPVDVKVKLAE